jgi:ribosomal protein L11 methyltransferase
MVELTLLCVAANADAVSDALIDEHGALSASVEDADAGTDAEQALFGEPGMAPPGGWDRSIVKALFLQADDAHRAMNDLRTVWESAVRLRSIELVPDQNWVTLTQAQFAPTEIAPGFWIVPSWHEPPPEASQVIRLDPGMAFGTGTHPTTRMCLRWLARRSQGSVPPWQRVLDYGCGSGILAISAARFGAASVEAVDIDPLAVEATRANARINGVSIQSGLPDSARGCYGLVLANILATPLKLLAPVLCGHLDAGGDLVLAGLLERQADDIAGVYAPWLDLVVSDSEEGWVLMTGARPAQRMASSSR